MKKIIAGISLMLALSACEDKLELNDPQSIVNGIALTSDQNVKLVLVGGYDALSDADMYGGLVMRNSELLAANDEIVFSGTYPEPMEIFTKGISTSNGNVSNLWATAYRTINISNNVLSALEVVNEEDRDQVEGEALFLRGVSYFELVRFFGKAYNIGDPAVNDGVPIVLTPTRGLDDRISAPRNSVKQVYDQVIDDLTAAASLLAEGDDDATRGTSAAANAILARVYLQMGNHTAARDAANAVISSGDFELNSSIESCFNGGVTSEDIFSIPVSTVDGVNQMQLFYGATAYAGRGDIEIEQSHLDLYDAEDDRLKLFYVDAATGDTRTGKWKEQYGFVKIIRLAEMYLIRAETNLRLGTSVGDSPLNDLNEIRKRSNLPELVGITLDDVLKERRLELAHEGHRIHDVKRLELSITEGGDIYNYDNDNLLFPVPQRERNVNPNLSQNNGYF